MKLAKTIQLDVSDNHIYDHPANPEEWAIAGTFTFLDGEPDHWSRKYRFAFQSSWLGLKSYGNSTFVQITKIPKHEYEFIIGSLAKHLIDKYNAPNIVEAKNASKKEIDDMALLCNHPSGTLLTIERSLVENGIKERTRVIKPTKERRSAKAWDIGESTD
tara:strand:+ start:706 stop:1185 length:480 start_codon:yes stop_codon:yes gene_type:complete